MNATNPLPAGTTVVSTAGVPRVVPSRIVHPVQAVAPTPEDVRRQRMVAVDGTIGRLFDLVA